MTGISGGGAGGDAKCNARAAAAGLGGTWVAWLSSDSVAAIDRIADAEYRDMDDVLEFANKAQITSVGRPSHGIDFNEFSTYLIGLNTARTGTTANGAIAGTDCSDWTDGAGAPNGLIGQPSTPINWSVYGFADCGNLHRLLCFEQ